MDKILNRKQFVLDSKSLKIKEILNKDFLEIEILAIAEGKNRNKTSFTLESMRKAIPTFYNKFILGYFNVQGDINNDGHFEEHNSDIKYDVECDEMYYSYLAPNAEKALGLIRESDKVEIVEIKGKKWIRLTAVILTKYNREAVKHLLRQKSKTKVSVEVTINKWHTDEGIDIIEDFTLDGITILGTRRNSSEVCKEGIAGASMILKFLKSENFGAQRRALNFAYKELDSLGTNEEVEEITMKNNQTKNKESKEEERGSLSMDNVKENEQVVEQNKENFVEDNDSTTETQQVSEETTDTSTATNFVAEDIQDDTNKEECAENKTEQDCDNQSFTEEDKEGKCSKEEVEDTEEKTEQEAKDINGEVFDCGECGEDDPEKPEEPEEGEKGEDDEEEKKEDNSCEEQECSDCVEEQECSNFAEAVAFSYVDSEGNTISFSCQPTSEAIQEVINTNFQAAFNSINKAYSELTESFNKLNENYNALKAEQTKVELIELGEKRFAQEDMLDEETLSELEESYNEKCKNCEFASTEEATDYLESQISKKFYQMAKQSKQSHETEKKEFSAKIKVNNDIENNKTMDSMEEMKSLLKM